jgi:rhodanese-related sulfurtransferase/DNA-binding transcriptional ArsR family regulator
MADPTRKSALFAHIARVGRALANGTRLELVDLLAQGERPVEALASAAGLRVGTASAHLQALRGAGLVSTRRDGNRIFYRLAGPDVAALYAALRDVAGDRLADVAAASAAYLGPGTEQVSREELLARVADGSVTVLDVRPGEEYAAGHIPGAVSIPLDELPARLAELPPDVPLVAYCRGAYCVLAHEAVRALVARGRSARRLEGGMLEWRLAGLPVDPATGGQARASDRHETCRGSGGGDDHNHPGTDRRSGRLPGVRVRLHGDQRAGVRGSGRPGRAGGGDGPAGAVPGDAQ